MPDLHAHSLPGRARGDWERLPDHLREVARGASDHAAAFGFTAIAHLAGLIHDIGKCSAAFQAYLDAAGETARGPDHSTAGAVEALRLYPGPLGRMLAFIVAGHHAGLADGTALDERLKKTIESYAGWDRHVGPLPEAKDLAGRLRKASSHQGFSVAFLIRMLFSCLVDADFVETERFYARAEGRPVERGDFTPLPVLQERLQGAMRRIAAGAAATPVNKLRATILDHALGKGSDMVYGVRLHVWGNRACFTRPEMKVERVSYDVMTPSAARGILEAILWKPQMRWVVDRIHVLKPIRFQSFRRNEVGAKISARNVEGAMRAGSTAGLGLAVDENRQQRAVTLLIGAAYVIDAHFELTDKAGPDDTTAKYLSMFNRRAEKRPMLPPSVPRHA